MSDTPDENDLAMEISMATFALRGHLTPIQGYAQILRLYLQERQKTDHSSIKIGLSPDTEKMEMTPQMAIQMMDTILNSVQQIYQLQEELRHKYSGFSEG